MSKIVKGDEHGKSLFLLIKDSHSKSATATIDLPTWYCDFVLLRSHLCYICFCRVLFLNKTDSPLQFKGNWLLTEPDEDQVRWGAIQARHFPIINKSRSVSYTPSRRVIVPKGAPLSNDLEEVSNMYTVCS